MAAAMIDRLRKTYERAYEAWSQNEELQLIKLAESGVTLECMAKQLQRQPSAIRSRLH